jgi:hypothetical protein
MITYPHYLREHGLAGSSQLFHSLCGSLEAAQTGEHRITLQQNKKKTYPRSEKYVPDHQNKFVHYQKREVTHGKNCKY